MMDLLKELILLGIFVGCGWLIARAKTFSDYNDMYSHLTCEIISRMTRAMRSLCMDQEDIDRVIQRMGCKLMPPACPRPPVPPSKDLEEESKCKQKPVDKVEPKFKAGDIIRLKGSAAEYTIKKVTDATYYTNGWSCGIKRCEEDYELVEQKPAEWSEIEPIIQHLDNLGNTAMADILRSFEPQPQWKPSDEQIEALLKLEEMHVLEHERNQENAHLYMVVKSIREQLLKLKEE